MGFIDSPVGTWNEGGPASSGSSRRSTPVIPRSSVVRRRRESTVKTVGTAALDRADGVLRLTGKEPPRMTERGETTKRTAMAGICRSK
jgi:hypothetical protein